MYPELYTWYIFLSAMDICFTWLILHQEGGRELNVLAEWIIERYDLRGVILFKFLLVVLVVVVCELVGRFEARVGRKLARWIVVLAAFPVVVGGLHLLRLSLDLQQTLVVP
jgi:hypothetical protein